MLHLVRLLFVLDCRLGLKLKVIVIRSSLISALLKRCVCVCVCDSTLTRSFPPLWHGTTQEWTEYDDLSNTPVGIFEVTHQFSKK